MPRRKATSVPDILVPPLTAIRAMRAYIRSELFRAQRQMQGSYGRIPLIPILRIRWDKPGAGWTAWEPGPWPEFTASDGYDGRAMRVAEFTVSAYRRFRTEGQQAINRLGIIQTWSQGVPQRSWLRHHGIGRDRDGKRNDVDISSYQSVFQAALTMIDAHTQLGDLARHMLVVWSRTDGIVSGLEDTASLDRDFTPWPVRTSWSGIEQLLTQRQQRPKRSS